MTIITSRFKPAWWLPGPHLQTLFPHLIRNRSTPALRRERIELADGDFLDIDWNENSSGPLVLLLHGLEGSIRSHYAAGLMSALGHCGFQVAMLNFRGCSGEPNRLPRSYHSGDTGDIGFVIEYLANQQPQRCINIVGVSLGGNVLLKWLGENSGQTTVAKAVAISVPFDLDNAAVQLERGLSRLYQNHLLRKLRRSTRLKSVRIKLPIDIDALATLKTFRDFDDRVTAPLHGFRNVDDYYQRSSSRPFIKHITTPTLIIHARDDPFMTPAAIPDSGELGAGVRLEVSDAGGHVGFIGGNCPWHPRYWLEERVCEYLSGKAGQENHSI